MIYPYKCKVCKHEWDVMKSVADIDRDESCQECGSIGQRYISSKIHLYGTKVEEYEYNPAFGQWIRGKKQRDMLAKEKGMIEIGNEDPNKMYDNLEKDRLKKAEKAWESI